MPIYLLADNGSKKAEATLRLRELAAELSQKTKKEIHAVSLQHADAIPAAEINNLPAETFPLFLHRQLQQGERDFVVIPLFFGASRALTSFIPQQMAILEEEFGSFNVSLTDVIFPLESGEPRLADIVHSFIQELNAEQEGKYKDVVLVDHGSPSPIITEVRKSVAERLQSLLGDNIQLSQAVMERREGKEYDFNGELLADWLTTQAKAGVANIIVAMLFFLPGRHAGACGDVEEICQSVVDEFPSLKITITPLISEHELLLDILNDRITNLS